MDLELSRETIRIMADYSWVCIPYGIAFLLALILIMTTKNKPPFVISSTGEKWSFTKGIVTIAFLIATTMNIGILASQWMFSGISNRVSGAGGSKIALNQKDEQEIRKGIMKDPSYLDRNAELLVGKVIQDSDKEIVTSVYTKDRHGTGCPHGLYIVRRVTKSLGTKNQENYQIYKSDSPELQNLLEKMNFDLSNN